MMTFEGAIMRCLNRASSPFSLEAPIPRAFAAMVRAVDAESGVIENKKARRVASPRFEVF